MRTIGRYLGPGRTYEGGLTISFEIDGEDMKALQKLDHIKESDLVIEVKKYFEKRSLDANGYFWKMSTEIAKALGSDKDTVYLMQLRKYGVFFDVRVKEEAVPMLKRTYRLAEAFDEWPHSDGSITVRCYIGSSHYDKKEMARLIDGTVQDAEELNIDTWTPEEIAKLLSVWEQEK